MKRTTKGLGVLLLGAAFIFLVLPSPARKATSSSNSPEFMQVDKMLGMGAEEARELLGNPEDELPEECGTESYPSIGTLWIYIEETETTIDELDVCFYKDFVIGQKKTSTVAEEGEISINTQEAVGVHLLEMLILMEQDSAAPSTFEETTVEI